MRLPADATNPMLRAVSRNAAIAICAVLIALFAVLSYSAVLTKSATYDEPMHALSGWIHLHLGDFRINFEDPPLWNDFAALANGPIQLDTSDPDWIAMKNDLYREWPFTNRTLFQTPGNDGIRFINRARFVMLLWGVALAIVIVIWAWQLAGPIAAILAALLFALDPNFLAHSSLVKNDVPLSLMMAATFFACWRAGRKLTIFNTAALCLLTAAAMNTKFSAILIAPMLILILLLRAFLPTAWPVLDRSLVTLKHKLLTASSLLVLIALTSYLGIWACYDFRFNASADPSVQPDAAMSRSELLYFRFQAMHPPPTFQPFDPNIPAKQAIDSAAEHLQTLNRSAADTRALALDLGISTESRAQIVQALANASALGRRATDLLNQAANHESEELLRQLHDVDLELHALAYRLQFLQYAAFYSDRAPDIATAAIDFFLDHHLLPSAWLNGILFVRANATVRNSYLLGQSSLTGWWYYFPLAMVFKMPAGTAGLLLLALLFGMWILLSRKAPLSRNSIWSIACLLIPFAIYFAVAMATNLNIGVRHILPVYPFIYIAAGVLLARALQLWGKAAQVAVAIFGIALACETALAWPNYIAFFGSIVGGQKNAFHLLSDSNLDWGQDLPELARWQRDHGNPPIALAYAGAIDPAAYGVKSQPLPPGPVDSELAKTHVIALGATLLQCVYNDGYKSYQSLTPTAVLGGGTIYVFDRRSAPATSRASP